jgi:hypothetical protein
LTQLERRHQKKYGRRPKKNKMEDSFGKKNENGRRLFFFLTRMRSKKNEDDLNFFLIKQKK